jgi:hypothetical protein
MRPIYEGEAALLSEEHLRAQGWNLKGWLDTVRSAAS